LKWDSDKNTLYERVRVTESGFSLTEEAQIVQQAIKAVAAEEGETAFLVLYDHYFSRVFTYFRYRCPDLQTCDDLTAQTFEQALTHLDDYDAKRGPFAAWLFGIARNAANLYFRRRLHFQWLALDKLINLSGHEPLPEEQVIQNAEELQLIAALSHLPDRQRDLLALKFSGGLNNREIAALMGLSEQNVAVILHRSIHILRQQLSDEGEKHV
jgi:RNA polymerase sigma factor (sigma-70 family)